jgi:hypothetical protein
MTLNSARRVKLYDVFWSPEGRCIATVEAKDQRAAKRKAPQPYRKYLGEMYSLEVADATAKCNVEPDCPRHGRDHQLTHEL